MNTDQAIKDYAANPEAHRETAVVFDEWNWRDELASILWAQMDYDERRLESLKTGEKMKPSPGWSPEIRLKARGAVDAVLVGIRRMKPEDRLKALKATRVK